MRRCCGSGMLNLRSIGLIGSLYMAFALSACGLIRSPGPSYRYKMILSLDTPDGVKTAYNVVEVDYAKVQFPMSGEPHWVRGQGLYLDMGPGRRPLIALLDRRRRFEDDPGEKGWNDDSPANIFQRHCHLTWDNGQSELAKSFQTCRDPISLATEDLPDLVTFDPKNPEPARSVDPDDLSATLGAGVRWRSRTIEITDEPVTKDIEERISLQPFEDKIIHILGIHPCCGVSPVIQPDALVRR